MSLGSKIRSARELAGLTREQLADQLLVSYKTIANWETDRTTPQNKLALLQAVLKTDLSGEPNSDPMDAIDTYRSGALFLDQALKLGVDRIKVFNTLVLYTEVGQDVFARMERELVEEQEPQQEQGSAPSSIEGRSRRGRGTPIAATPDEQLPWVADAGPNRGADLQDAQDTEWEQELIDDPSPEESA